MVRFIFILFLFTQVCYSQKWIDIHLSGSGSRQVWATSELSHPDDDLEDYFSFNRRYGVFNLLDGKPSTAWVEGEKGSGIGVSVYILVPENFRRLEVFNGYGKNFELFKKNNRVKTFHLSIYAGIHPEGFVSENGMAYLAQKFPLDCQIHLKDIFGKQTVDFPFSWDELYDFRDFVIKEFHREYDIPKAGFGFIIQLEIADVYKGSAWDDTCLSEIEFHASYLPGVVYPEVLNIYTGESDDSRVYMDNSSEKKVLLIDDAKSVFQVMEWTSDKQWVSIIKMPVSIDEGRVETEWLIVNTFLGKIMNSEIENMERIHLSGPFYLTEKGGKTILEHSGGELILN